MQLDEKEKKIIDELVKMDKEEKQGLSSFFKREVNPVKTIAVLVVFALVPVVVPIIDSFLGRHFGYQWEDIKSYLAKNAVGISCWALVFLVLNIISSIRSRRWFRLILKLHSHIEKIEYKGS